MHENYIKIGSRRPELSYEHKFGININNYICKIILKSFFMKKSFILLIIIALGFNFTYAQLSDRVNSPSTFKIGTRPVAGNWGLVIAPSYQDFNDIINRIDGDDSTNVKNVLPVIALRIYKSDNTVWRIGLRSKSSNLKISGDFFIPDSVWNGNLTELKYQRRQAELYITPGIEHHFSKSNILDVYLGACIPLGYVKENQTDYLRSTTADYVSYERTRFSFAYGFEGFIGVQAFVADLPLSIGVELGTTALGKLGKKWKVKYASKVGTTTTDQTYYTLNLDNDDQIDPLSVAGLAAQSGTFEKLHAKSFGIDGMARLTLSYYFNK